MSALKLLKVVALEEAGGVQEAEVVAEAEAEGRQALSAIGAERNVIHSHTHLVSKYWSLSTGRAHRSFLP